MVLVKDQIEGITCDKNQELDKPSLSRHICQGAKGCTPSPREIGLDKIEIKINWIFSQGAVCCTPPPREIGLDKIEIETLPKAQRTRGFSSYHNILQFQNLDKALTLRSQPNISISTKSKVRILTKPNFRILTKIQLRNLD